jgi:hypothetical protein
MSTTEATKFEQRRKQYSVSKKPSMLNWVYAHPLEKKQHEEMGWPDYEVTMEDMSLTNVYNLAVPSTITKKIMAMIRLKSIDVLGLGNKNSNSKCEFVYIQIQIDGQDGHGNKVAGSYSSEGSDVRHELRTTYSSDDEPTYSKGLPRTVYTLLWKGKETFDEIVSKNGYEIDLDTCQFAVSGSKSWGNFSSSEFRELDWAELEERGRRGLCQMPIDTLFSKQDILTRAKEIDASRKKDQ